MNIYIKRARRLFYACMLTVGLAFSSCKKFIEVDPPVTSVTGPSAYSTDATAAAVLTGLYTDISGTTTTSPNVFRFLSLYAGLSADELTLFADVTDNRGVLYYRNALVSSPGLDIGSEFWTSLYQYIYRCNDAIEGLTQSQTLTPSVKKQLLGEAKFLRALFYFYLVNLHGDVPLVLETDYQINRKIPRTPKADVYTQIVKDLSESKDLLSTQYLDGTVLHETADRVRPTQMAAYGLLARVYLYKGDWANAETAATSLINNTGTFSLPADLNEVFLNTSSEAIWQLQPVIEGNNTEEAMLYIIPPTGPTSDFYTNPVYLSKYLLQSFEVGDKRRMNWVDSVIVNADTFYYAYKYKINQLNSPVSEYLNVFRLAEQYLIRSEARAMLNNIQGAQQDLNVIRSRAGLSNTTASSQTDLLSAILHERQVELFTEWGHRWLDLKRTGLVNQVMSTVTPGKGGVWNANWQLYPLPFSELQNAPQLGQNSGY